MTPIHLDDFLKLSAAYLEVDLPETGEAAADSETMPSIGKNTPDDLTVGTPASG